MYVRACVRTCVCVRVPRGGPPWRRDSSPFRRRAPVCVRACACVCVCACAWRRPSLAARLFSSAAAALISSSREAATKLSRSTATTCREGGGGERGSEGARERGREPFPEKRVYVTPPQTARRRERDGKSGKESENSEALNRGRESENSEMAQSRAACGYAFIAGVYVYVRAYGPVSCNPPPARSAFSPTPLSPLTSICSGLVQEPEHIPGRKTLYRDQKLYRHLGARSQVQAGGNLAWRHLQGRPVGPRDDGLGSRERE